MTGKDFAPYVLQEGRVRSLIFCNLSPLLRIIVRIGRRLNTSEREIHVVEDYREVIDLALMLCDIHRIDPGPFVFGRRIRSQSPEDADRDMAAMARPATDSNVHLLRRQYLRRHGHPHGALCCALPFPTTSAGNTRSILSFRPF